MKGNTEDHRSGQDLENARFLLDNGEHISRVAKRLGLSVNTLQKKLERDGKRQPDPHQVTRGRP